MFTHSIKIFVYGAWCINSLFLLQSCTDAKTAENSDPMPFCLTDTLMSQLSLDTVKMKTVQNELKLSGKITFNEDKIAKVYPLVGGNVEDLKVELGDYVQKGQVLAVIRSGEIAEFENQLITAQSNQIIAKKNLDVAEDMFQSGLNSEKDVVTARKDLQKAESELNRIQEVLNLYGVGKKSIYTVKAPISGFIVEKNINENMHFRSDNMDNLFTISNVEEVWTVANVFESDIAKVKLGLEASVTTLSYPDVVFTGKVDKIFNALDPESRVMKIRIKMQNKDFKLKPDMFANVVIRYQEDKQMLEIPVEDVIFDKNKNFVMLYNAKCDIETREVRVYKIAGARAYIQSGLKEGERVFSRNKLLVYDALND
jgi:cobalt-zinc-cadmium efflux system membrane fusion protein